MTKGREGKIGFRDGNKEPSDAVSKKKSAKAELDQINEEMKRILSQITSMSDADKGKPNHQRLMDKLGILKMTAEAISRNSGVKMPSAMNDNMLITTRTIEVYKRDMTDIKAAHPSGIEYNGVFYTDPMEAELIKAQDEKTRASINESYERLTVNEADYQRLSEHNAETRGKDADEIWELARTNPTEFRKLNLKIKADECLSSTLHDEAVDDLTKIEQEALEYAKRHGMQVDSFEDLQAQMDQFENAPEIPCWMEELKEFLGKHNEKAQNIKAHKHDLQDIRAKSKIADCACEEFGIENVGADELVEEVRQVGEATGQRQEIIENSIALVTEVVQERAAEAEERTAEAEERTAEAEERAAEAEEQELTGAKADTAGDKINGLGLCNTINEMCGMDAAEDPRKFTQELADKIAAGGLGSDGKPLLDNPTVKFVYEKLEEHYPSEKKGKGSGDITDSLDEKSADEVKQIKKENSEREVDNSPSAKHQEQLDNNRTDPRGRGR